MSKKALFERSSQEFSGNAAYLENLYEHFSQADQTLSEPWSAYFTKVSNGRDQGLSHQSIREDIIARVQHTLPMQAPETQSASSAVAAMQQHYQHHGHLYANIDPLGLIATRAPQPSLSTFGVAADAPISESCLGLEASSTYQMLLSHLQAIYCGAIGIEFMHIQDPEKRDWLAQYMTRWPQWQAAKDVARHALYKLQCAEQMELVLGRKFVGQTRFSLEGGDALIPLIEQIMSQSAQQYDVEEMIIGMPHRGRLNVMLNILGMRFDEICDIYTGKREDVDASSDVTYHMGYSSDRQFGDKTAHLSLAYNPSHLEFITPVVMGSVKSRQQKYYTGRPEAVLPILLHGDSAVCGQGVVAEWFNMMHAPAHQIHGGIHIVVNNQIGFTTYREASRSGIYCTDAHRYADVPILHVNGNDTHAVLFCAEMAAAYRARFKRSIILDLNCYRKYGHNEGDDPRFTQPLMYEAVAKQHTPRALFQQQCCAHYGLDASVIAQDEATIKTKLKQGDRLVALVETQPILQQRESVWQGFVHHLEDAIPNTGLSSDAIGRLVAQLTHVPETFALHRQVEKLFDEYTQAAQDQHAIRWGLAEQLAYASLIEEGYDVRLVGQDVERGTFSHRHAMLHDQKTGAQYCPLQHIKARNHAFQVFNSVLSEQAVLGFEYGFSGVDPNTLTIWEAQYGDFCNGGQVIIDQFISSAWQKWKRLSGLVMLLPHGYEGAGPEHSSARLERFLQLCAQHNMRVCVPSNAAQMFHLLRMQMKQNARVPLVVMTPKKSLRLPEAMSPRSEFCEGSFQTILPETDAMKPKQIKRALLCSGKIYYDLMAYRVAHKRDDVAILRVEQLYPFDEALCGQLLMQYTKLKEVVWCQEEPRNQGAWYTIRHHLEASIQNGVRLACVSRIRSASPAAGYQALHKKRQQNLIEAAFNDL